MSWIKEGEQWVCDVCWIEVPGDVAPEGIRHNCIPGKFKARRLRLRGAYRDWPCLYRGEKLREATMELCGGSRGEAVAIHRCLLHGDECTLRKYCHKTPGQRFCNVCQDRFTADQNEGYEWHDAGRVTYKAASRVAVRNRILLRFGHGLGDAVFLTPLLKHLRELRPDLLVDVLISGSRRGLIEHLLEPHRGGPYEAEYDVRFYECDRVYPDGRTTKWGKALWEEFGVRPCDELMHFDLPRTTVHDEPARAWAAGRPLVLLHTEGYTSKASKDLPRPVVEQAAECIAQHGGVPVLIDRSGRRLRHGISLRQCPWVPAEPRILFLDDLVVRWNTISQVAPGALWVKSKQECIEQLLAQPWDVVSLDHDLNHGEPVPEDERDSNSGTHLAQWMSEHLDQLRIGRLLIHSTNRSGSERMQRILHRLQPAWVPFLEPVEGRERPFDPERWRKALAMPPADSATWLLALARQAKLCIGIDSGPGHIFAGSGTPTIQCWTKHHPVHYGNPAPTVTHLVPRNHEDWIYGEPDICRDWLAKNHTLAVYDDLGTGLTREIVGWLSAFNR